MRRKIGQGLKPLEGSKPGTPLERVKKKIALGGDGLVEFGGDDSSFPDEARRRAASGLRTLVSFRFRRVMDTNTLFWIVDVVAIGQNSRRPDQPLGWRVRRQSRLHTRYARTLHATRDAALMQLWEGYHDMLRSSNRLGEPTYMVGEQVWENEGGLSRPPPPTRITI